MLSLLTKEIGHMSTIQYNVIVRYRYDGEDNDLMLTVNASNKKAAQAAARQEARGIIEEGIRFTVPLHSITAV